MQYLRQSCSRFHQLQFRDLNTAACIWTVAALRLEIREAETRERGNWPRRADLNQVPRLSAWVRFFGTTVPLVSGGILANIAHAFIANAHACPTSGHTPTTCSIRGMHPGPGGERRCWRRSRPGPGNSVAHEARGVSETQRYYNVYSNTCTSSATIPVAPLDHRQDRSAGPQHSG